MRRAARTDRNHAPIRDGLRRVPGFVVVDTSRLGDGFPDLLVGHRKQWIPLEVKDPAQPPSRRRLTPAEAEFRRGCELGSLPCFVVETLDQAVAVVRTATDGGRHAAA